MKFFFLAYLVLVLPCILSGQSLPIAIDGEFSDWSNESIIFDDAGDAGNNLDILRMSVANDEQYLFLKIELSEEIILIENNDLTLFIDGDNNSQTGKSVNGIGAELELKFSDLEGIFRIGNSNYYINFDQIGYHHLPTFSSEVFEIAISRSAVPIGANTLFTGSKTRILVQNGAGDKLPNTGETFLYEFDDSPTPAYQPIDLQKLNASHLRLVTWNTLFDGLLDNDRKPHFKRILAVLQPDIVTFNECWDMTPGQAASFMNEAVPLGGFQSWYAAKLDAGNITVSRFPILENWEVYPNHRLTASLIDLPDSKYAKDFLVVNGHLRCCEANYERQQEADAFAKFVLDAKAPGGIIDLPEGTPIVLSGDMNLVGWQQQYTTLFTGEVINTDVFGNGGPLDWDGTDLLDVLALQADQRMAYTWHEVGNSYPPSRLDFHFCTNSVMQVAKAFCLQTELMAEQRLEMYGLYADDNSQASDHLPKVTDFKLEATNPIVQTERETLNLQLHPNPANEATLATWQNERAGNVQFQLKSMDGRLLKQWQKRFPSGISSEEVPLKDLESGTYLLEIRLGDHWLLVKQLVKN